MRYRGNTGKEALFFEIKPALFGQNRVSVIGLDEACHDSESILIHIFIRFFLFHLQFGLARVLVLSHMVEVRSLDGALVYTPEHILLLCFFGLHCKKISLVMRNLQYKI